MGVSRLSAALRIALGVSLVGFALGAGLMQRPPWILPFMGAGFAAAYRFGQLRTWRLARNTGTLRQYWLQLPADFGVQLGLVSVLYLIGFGLSALLSGGVKVASFAPGDAIWPLAAGAVASIFGVYVDRIEGKPASLFPSWINAGGETGPEAGRADISLLPAVVTLASFYLPQSADEPDDEAPEADPFTPSRRGLSEDDITRVEARLGRALPDLLIALYRMQNGGGVGDLCIPKGEVAEPSRFEDILTPFGGYNDLIPAQSLRTVWDTVTDYADPRDPSQADQFPDGCKAMIVLAQWYRETLFLDYNQPGAPRVGYVDFDRFDTEGKREPITWWPDFETFFAALRHYETV